MCGSETRASDRSSDLRTFFKQFAICHASLDTRDGAVVLDGDSVAASVVHVDIERIVARVELAANEPLVESAAVRRSA